MRELSSSRDDYSKFQALNAEVLGISANVRFSQKAFAESLSLNYPLLSDSRGHNVIKAYGVYNEKRQRAKRSYFIIDKNGIVRFKKVMPSGRNLLPNEELLKEIERINQGS
ncbi:MAG: redoxin domain-containing protein [Deltaproteobacteria bacterium]|nr:redoxin domain-containing protein [Deltaproteobacteria bacterium]